MKKKMKTIALSVSLSFGLLSAFAVEDAWYDPKPSQAEPAAVAYGDAYALDARTGSDAWPSEALSLDARSRTWDFSAAFKLLTTKFKGLVLFFR